MPGSIIEQASIEEIARAALKRATEARDLALRANQRIDELENANARTIESMKAMFSSAVRENSREQAKAIDQQTKAIEGITSAVKAIEGRRDRDFANMRAVFVVLSIVLTMTVEFCRRT